MRCKFTLVVHSAELEHFKYSVQEHDGKHQVIISNPNLEYLVYDEPAGGVNLVQNLTILVQNLTILFKPY